jgi:monoamine oxidase
LGILQKNLIQFNPPLPEPYQKAISSIGNGFQNKLFASFKEAFWGHRKGWINFVLEGKKHIKGPIAYIYPAQNNILVIFVAGKASIELD